MRVPEFVNPEGPTHADELAAVARGYSLRMALYRAVWELIATAEVAPMGQATMWEARLAFSTGSSGRYASGAKGAIDVSSIEYPITPLIARLAKFDAPPAPPDIFLQGDVCDTLHHGIRHALEQSLLCFRQSLYMPAAAMLAAAVEATWAECCKAVAERTGSDKLREVAAEYLAGVGKVASETRKALEQADAKGLLKAAGVTTAGVRNAELWTAAVRERRNALHWSKANSFALDHSTVANLLTEAPVHLGTLEKLRLAAGHTQIL